MGASSDSKKKRELELRKNVVMTEHKTDEAELLASYETHFAKEGQSKGLTSAKAAAMQEKLGPNRLTPPPSTPWYVKFFHELTGFFSLLLWAGGALCFLSYYLQSDDENMYLGVVLWTVVFVTGVFSFYQNSKADNLMNEFAKMKPPKVNVTRDGVPNQMIDPDDVTVGDICHLKTGDRVPADIRILEIMGNCCVDNASLTGESEPIKRKPECTDEEPLETQNLAFFGTEIPEGECIGVVVKIGDETMMGRIASLAMTTEAVQTPINKEIEHFIHIISAIAIFLGVGFFLIGVQTTEITENLVFMIGIIVANVPEGLLATVTVCLTLTAKRMYVKQVMVKNLEGVETLGSTSCICSDKTGTLTQNIMTVAQLTYGDADGHCRVQEAGSSFSKGVLTYKSDNKCFQRLCKIATLNNTCFFDKKGGDPTGPELPFKVMQEQEGSDQLLETVLWQPIGNASEAAMIKFTQALMEPLFGVPDIDVFREKHIKVFDIPFNSKYKYQVHIHQAEGNKGPRSLYMKGAPERVLVRCSEVLADTELIPMTSELMAEIDAVQSKMSNNGLRCLGFAERELDPTVYPEGYPYGDGKELEPRCSTPNFPLGEFEANDAYQKAVADGTLEKDMIAPHPNSAQGLVFVGMMALIDPPRPAVPGAVALCKTAGIKVIMVTGDHPDTAKAIAHKVGILWGPTAKDIEAENEAKGVVKGDPEWVSPSTAQAIVVPGKDIDVEMGNDKWDVILGHPQIVFARTSPQQKLVIVANNQRLGHIVAVTGDGVNDSPAIKKADIGIAMGIAGTPVTKNAGDMILLDDNFASIVAGVEEGRLIFDNLKKSICYTLTSNIPEISPFLCYITVSTPLPLTTVLILAIDLGTDMVPAISMAYEEAEADIMRRPPRNAATDRLVTRKLMLFAYLQIGMMQAMAGFYAWMVILNDYGYPPHILASLGVEGGWNKYPLFCRFNGGQYVNPYGEIDTTRNPEVDAPGRDFPLWDRGDDGYIIDCEFPLKNYAGGNGLSKSTTSVNFKYTIAASYGKQTEGSEMITIESMLALEASSYFEYVPWRGRMSPFWQHQFLAWDIEKKEGFSMAFGSFNKNRQIIHFTFQPAGLWTICGKDPSMSSSRADTSVRTEGNKAVHNTDMALATAGAATPACTGKMDGYEVYQKAYFCNGDYSVNTESSDTTWVAACDALQSNVHQVFYCAKECSFDADKCEPTTPDAYPFSAKACQNIAPRMVQEEALSAAQGGYWVSIVVVQWADLLICKTRWLSIRQQGLRNSTLNFGLFFETLLAAWLCYCIPLNVLGTRPLRVTHWFPGIPWSILIFVYDETRKYLMRVTSPEVVDKETMRVHRIAGWLEENTYY